jgi:hypothetical protein
MLKTEAAVSYHDDYKDSGGSASLQAEPATNFDFARCKLVDGELVRVRNNGKRIFSMGSWEANIGRSRSVTSCSHASRCLNAFTVMEAHPRCATPTGSPPHIDGLGWRRVARVRIENDSNVLGLVPQTDDPLADFSVICAVEIWIR